MFDPNLVFLVVDNLFGGDGRFHTRVEGRDFTPTEQRIIQRLLERRLRPSTRRPGSRSTRSSFEYVRSEMNTQFANIATPSEIVVVDHVHARARRGNRRDMHICIPYSMLEPIRDVLYSTMQSDARGAGPALDRTADASRCRPPRSSSSPSCASTELTVGQLLQHEGRATSSPLDMPDDRPGRRSTACR